MVSIHSMLPVVSRRLASIPSLAPVLEAAKLLAGKQIGLVVVCNEKGSMCGIVTKTDIIKEISHCTGCSCKSMVSEVMTSEVVSCRPEDKLGDVWKLMRESALREVPVIDDESRPVGVLYANDALQELLKEVEYEELLLRDYVMGIGYQ